MYLVVIAFAIELLFAFGSTYPPFAIIGTLALVITAFGLPPVSNLLILSFLIPNQRLLVLVEGGNSVVNLSLLILFTSFLLKGYRIPTRLWSFSLLVVSYFGLVSLVTLNSFAFLVSIKISLLIYVMCFFIEKAQHDYSFAIGSLKFYLLGVVFTGLIGVILEGGIIVGTSDRFSGGDINNPNILSSHFSFSFALLLVLCHYRLINPKNLLYFGIPFCGLGLLTQSRSFLLVIGVVTIIYLIQIFSVYYFARVVKNIFVVLTGGIILYFLWPEVIDKVIQAPLERVLDPKHDDISGGRIEIWKQYIQAFQSDPLYLTFGQSLNQEILLKIGKVGHNMFLETISSFGIVGFILYSFLLLQLFKNFKRKLSNKLLLNRWFTYAPLLAIILSGMTGHSFVNMGTIWIFSLWLISYSIVHIHQCSVKI